MNNGIKIHTLRVFVDEKGNFGNPVGVILDEKNQIDKKERQRITTGLGFSESVFINDLRIGDVSIFNPRKEVSFAGHAMVGTAWFINKTTSQRIDSLTCAGGSIKTWVDNDKIWIRANLSMMPAWQFEQLKNTMEVVNLSPPLTLSKKHTFVWAWLDEIKGLIRARTFAPDWGIPEDEANGSGSMKLAATLGRSIEIMHGKGSIIYAKPWKSDFVDLGGRVIEI
ncbi:PhzF family phenazine biosynthesis protein [Candidatus Gottesmanbacteria bacterium]|nr:PhzF family phenazine biosynthesis protein [Candidatus Gottesmanbacteria bacterium]